MINPTKSMNSHDELLQAYTTMFLFLGSSVSLTPAEGGLQSLCEKGFLRNLPVTSNNQRFSDAARLLKSPCPYSGQCKKTISENYENLFNSGSHAQAPLMASTWKYSNAEDDSRLRNLQIIYKRYGFDIDEKCGLGYDHLSMELLFLNMLLEKYPQCPWGYVFSCAPYSELPEQKLKFLPLYYA
ncbi:MAG: molecular chaperone TorD family protein, partial [Bacteroidales bacterium]|nr:molecular chaperone TorD family protein [Bacteroidales bacterium]